MNAIRSWFRARWDHLVPEPRWLSIMYTFGYALMVGAGIVTLVTPPQTLTGAVGEVSMAIAAYLWLIGGLIGMTAGQREWWEGERFALGMMLTGIVFYAWIVASLHFTQAGSRLTQLCILGLAALLLLVRFGFIWRYPFKPRG